MEARQKLRHPEGLGDIIVRDARRYEGARRLTVGRKTGRDDDWHVAPTVVTLDPLEQLLAVGAEVFDVYEQEVRACALQDVDESPPLRNARDLLTLLPQKPREGARGHRILIGNEHVWRRCAARSDWRRFAALGRLRRSGGALTHARGAPANPATRCCRRSARQRLVACRRA